MIQEKVISTLESKRLRFGVRVVWVALTLLLLLFFTGGIPYRFQELNRSCRQARCPLMALTVQEAQALFALGFSLDAYAAWQIGMELFLGILMAALALFLFWRSFDSTQGILVTFMLTLLGLNLMVEPDTAFVEHNPLFLPLYDFITAMTGVALILFLLVFPDGRFAPRWTRFPFALFVVVSILEPFLPPGADTISIQFSYFYLVAFLLSLLIGFGAQVFRYRRVSTAVERQQTKWVLVGLAVFSSAILVYATFVEFLPLEPGMTRLLFYTVGCGTLVLLISFLPISMVISILRYRLWDVDLIIRRTLVYTVLTAMLALIYFAGVVLLQLLFNSLMGHDSALAIVLSTLAIAALFAPLRRRIQNFFNRRFYRQNYDAAQTLARFARAARDEVDLDALTRELAGVVRDTMQPQHFSLWLRR